MKCSREAPQTFAACEGVRISAVRGSVRIEAPELFSADGQRWIPVMADRLLSITAVEAIEVNCATGTIRVNYAPSRMTLADALACFAKTLGAGVRNGSATAQADQGWRSFAGTVARIERPGARGGWPPARLRRVLARMRGFVGHGGDEVVVVSGLVVRYRQAPPVVAANASQSLVGRLPARNVAGEPGAPHRHLPAEAPSGLRRLANLTAAGGCFVLSIIGLVVPGIPTVPFVLATSYFLVRSSPALDARLRRSKLFGQMVRDWQAYRGMRPSTKWKIVWLTVGIVVVTILIAGPSPILLLTVTCMATLGTALILRLPTVAEDAPDDASSLPELDSATQSILTAVASP